MTPVNRNIASSAAAFFSVRMPGYAWSSVPSTGEKAGHLEGDVGGVALKPNKKPGSSGGGTDPGLGRDDVYVDSDTAQTRSA